MRRLKQYTFAHAAITLLLCATSITLMSQTIERHVVASAGTEVSVGNIDISYTVGEAVAYPLTNGNLILTQGYQQPDAKAVATALPEVRNITQLLTAYPNPTRDVVHFRVEGYDGQLTAELINMEGRMMLPQAVAFRGDEEYTIDMTLMPSGQYILRVTDTEDKAQGFYKIIKIR